MDSQDSLEYPDAADDWMKRNVGTADSNLFYLSTSWFDLNNEQQKIAVQVVESLKKRRYSVKPYLTSFNRSLYYLVNGELSSPERVTEFLSASKSVVNSGSKPKQVLQFFRTCTNLFKHNALYYGQNSKVMLENGAVSIAFEEDKTGYLPDEYLDAIEEEESFDEDTTDLDEDYEDDDAWDDDNWDDTDIWDDYDDNENVDNFEGDEDVNILEFGMDDMGSAVAYSGPKIIVESGDLLIETPYDTIYISGAVGEVGIFERRFSGTQGQMNWTKHEFEEEVYAELGNYDFLLSRPAFSSENSKMHFPELFDDPISGVFSFRTMSWKKGGNKYPRFHSYSSNHEYKTIRDEMHFKGGFNLVGKVIHSAGLDGGKSTMQVDYKGEKAFKVVSKRFYIEDSLAQAHRSKVSIYLFEDSLTHPELSLKYGLDSKRIQLYWEEGSNRYLPMLDSYHRLEVVADKLWYTLGDNRIDFGIMSGRSEVPMKLRSDENFDEQDYNRMKNLFGFNPINTVYNYQKKTKNSSFDYRELASYYNLNKKKVFGAMKGIAGQGYIGFDRFTGMITVNKKTKHAYLSRMKKEDFDNVEIYSTVPTGRNGYIDLDSGIFYVKGVTREIVSRGLGVFFEPDSGILKIYENRNMVFDGRVTAGHYEIIGKDFEFNYSSFLFSINHLDSINFTISDSLGVSSSQQILGGSIKNTAGTLYLNEIDNKSGLKSLPQYPILDITAPTYVYFDNPNVLNGAYNKEVYFEIPHFKVDSVESDNPNVIHLAGTFHSGGMVPEFETKLIVMPDLSLGFDYDVPDDGFPIYESEATFYDHLTLDRGGLYGSGLLTYMASVMESDTFTFYQDSLYSETGTFEVAQGDYNNISFPHAETNSFAAAFIPKRKELVVRNKEGEIDLYNGIATLDGKAIVSPVGLKGFGIARTKQTKTFSEAYLFKETSFVGRNSKFKIDTDYDSYMPGLMAVDAKMTFDFLENTAKVEPETEGNASLEMPLLQMKTSIPVGIWDLTYHTFTMTKPEGYDIQNSYLFSTDPLLDSLAFSADSAVYDVESNTLFASGVPAVYVADAKIIPGDGKIDINEDGEVEPIEGASILMDKDWEYHYLTDASVEIFSANEFEADAIYKYDNGSGDTMDIIFEGLHQDQVGFKRKELDSATIGLSEIFPEDNFYISPKIIYQGNVDVYANEKYLHFDGEIRLDLKHSDEFNDWLPFKWTGDADEITIEIKEAEGDEEEQLLTTGIHYDPSEQELYYTFISSKRFDEDEDVFKSVGLLGVIPEEGKFEMGSREKLEENTIEGNLFTYDDSASVISFEGEFAFAGTDEPVEFKSVGRGRAQLDSANYTFQTLSVMNFPIPNSAMNEMGRDLSESTDFVDYLNEALPDNGLQYNRLAQMIGENGADNFEQQLNLEYLPIYMANNKLAKGLLMADLKMAWHKEENAFYNYDTIGVASVMKNDINARMKSYLEVRKGYDGSIVNLYVELLPNCWYYLNYNAGSVRAYSSNYVFNDIISSKQTDGEVKEGELELALAGKFEVMEYITFFNNTYLNNPLTEDDLKLDENQPELESGIMAEQKSKEYEDGGDDYGDDWEDDDWGGDEWGDEEEEDEGAIIGGAAGAAGAAGGSGDPQGGNPQSGNQGGSDSPLEQKDTKKDEDADDWGGDDWGEEEEDSDEWGGYEEENSGDQFYGAPPPKKEKKKKEKKVKEPKAKKEKKPKEQDYFPEEEDDWGGDEWGEEDQKPVLKTQEEDDYDNWGDDEEEEKPVIISNPKNEEKKEPIKVEEDDVDDFSGDDWGEEEEEEKPVIISKPKKEEKKEPIKVEEDDVDDFGGEDWGEEEEEEKPVIISKPKKEEKKEPIEVEEDDIDDFGGEDWGEEEEEEKPVIISKPKKEEKKEPIKVEEDDVDNFGGEDWGEEEEEEKPVIISKPKKEEKKEPIKVEEDDVDDFGGEDWGEEEEEEKPVIISKPKKEEKKEEKVIEQDDFFETETKKEKKPKKEPKPIQVEEDDDGDDWGGDDWGEEDEEEKPVIIKKEEKKEEKDPVKDQEEVKKDEKAKEEKKKEDDKKGKKEKKPVPPPAEEEDDWDDDDDDGF